MKKQINDLLLKMQNGENCIGETANQLLDLFAVSKPLVDKKFMKWLTKEAPELAESLYNCMFEYDQ